MMNEEFAAAHGTIGLIGQIRLIRQIGPIEPIELKINKAIGLEPMAAANS